MNESSDHPRLYCCPLVGGVVELSAEEARHAATLRLGAGDAVELFDGAGQVAAGVIEQASRRHAAVRVEQVLQVARPGGAVEVAFAVPKHKRIDWLIEKATELGAASLRPICFERSVAGGEQLGENKRSRWESHILAAAKQSRRAWLPALREITPLAELLADKGLPAVRIVGDTTGQPRRLKDIDLPSGERCVILVGPEGGFTPVEREQIAAAGFSAVRLGETVLRIETAAVALLAAVAAVKQ
jgi:16S rRNA (uracil1498-N3)-methyltransferase